MTDSRERQTLCLHQSPAVMECLLDTAILDRVLAFRIYEYPHAVRDCPRSLDGDLPQSARELGGGKTCPCLLVDGDHSKAPRN